MQDIRPNILAPALHLLPAVIAGAYSAAPAGLVIKSGGNQEYIIQITGYVFIDL